MAAPRIAETWTPSSWCSGWRSGSALTSSSSAPTSSAPTFCSPLADTAATTPRLINRRYETWFNKWQWKKRSMTKATQDIKNHASFIGRCINLCVCKFIITLNSMNLNIHHCLSYINWRNLSLLYLFYLGHRNSNSNWNPTCTKLWF